MTITDITEASPRSNVDWGAIFGGAAVTTAFALVLLAFGAALGLGFTSPYDGEGLSPVAFAIAAGLYLLWVQVMAFFFGGYIAARLRARAPGVGEHEADVRDGLHGLIVWGVGVLAAGVIAFAGIGGAGAAGHTPMSSANLAASVGHVVDEKVQQGAAQEATASPAADDATAAEHRAEIARKLSIISAFITAASLLVGAVAAFYGAHSGGHHRDRNVSWAFFTSKARVRRIGQ